MLEGMQAVNGVAPNAFLGAGYPSLVKVMRFIEATTTAAYADKKLRKLFATPNWVLDAKQLESFFQLVGEVQFWMLAHEKGVELERIPEGKSNTADLKMAGAIPGLPQFEVKTLSVSGGGWMHLAKMAEESFNAQLEVEAKLLSGATVAFSEQSIAPHGEMQQGKEYTEMCRHLIDKAVGNIKAGQYASAPTFMVLNLMLIGSHYDGNMELRPVAAGYPERSDLHTGVLWTTGFGTMGQLIHRSPEFEGKPCIEGFLGREGVLAHPDFKQLAGLLLVIHSLSKEPTIYGLMRAGDMDSYQSSGNHTLLDAFHKLTGHDWNDDLDSNGWRLTEH
ncbi:hypothetical protein Cthiooxydans_46580 [Comamonas thiooxydans]|nr:hypothetical protein Cthiooxydans_46580 [Comamonas thiooxydans]